MVLRLSLRRRRLVSAAVLVLISYWYSRTQRDDTPVDVVTLCTAFTKLRRMAVSADGDGGWRQKWVTMVIIAPVSRYQELSVTDEHRNREVLYRTAPFTADQGTKTGTAAQSDCVVLLIVVPDLVWNSIQELVWTGYYYYHSRCATQVGTRMLSYKYSTSTTPLRHSDNLCQVLRYLRDCMLERRV